MVKKLIRDYLGITIGVILTALGLDMFLIPNKIAAGGVSGIGTILFYLFHIQVGLTMLIINIPLFLLSVKQLGIQIGMRSLYGTISLSIFIDLLAKKLPIPTHNPILAAVYGGILVGLGIGIVFKFKGTTGGTDLAAALIRRLTGHAVGFLLFTIDGMVIIAAGLVFNAELALLALITVYLTGRIIDFVQEGFNYAKAVFIISDDSNTIADAVLKQMDRGVTAMSGRGAFTGTDKDVLLSVVGRGEISRLKELVREIDPGAFVIVTDVHEVLGEGFKRI